MNYFITYLVSLISLGILDYVRLAVIMKSQIHKWMGGLMKDQLSRGPALAFYILYTVAILMFAILPAARTQNINYALGYGALLGFTAYMTYDLTNWATLKNWPIAMVAPDIVRGTVVTAIVAVVGYLVLQYFGNAAA